MPWWQSGLTTLADRAVRSTPEGVPIRAPATEAARDVRARARVDRPFRGPAGPPHSEGVRSRRAITVAVLVLGGTVLFLAGLLPATASAASEVERANCPAGFVWIRMSGTGCVQEVVPPHGKIGYDGHALCVEPYIGIYESRATTDGKPAPGGPYTSFAYLKKCVTQEQYDAAIQKTKENQTAAPSGVPSTIRTGLAGLAVVAGLVALGGAAVLVNRRRGPSADETAAENRKRQRRQELQTDLAEATVRRDRLRDLRNQIRSQLGTGDWGPEGLNSIAGMVAALASLGGSVPIGVASILSTSGGELAALTQDEADRRICRLLEELERTTGGAEAEVEAITRDLAEIDSQVAPDRLAAESFTDHDVLQAQIDTVNAETLQLMEQRNAHETRRAEIRVQLNDVDNLLSDIRNQLWEVEYGAIEHDAIGHAANLTSIMAGLAALGPFGATAVAGAGLVSALANAAGFTEYMVGRDVAEISRLLNASTQGYERIRGQLLYQLEDEARRQANAQALLDNAQAYHDRLREQQAQIDVSTNRGVLWPKH